MAEGSSGHYPGGNRRPHRTGHHQLHNLSSWPMIEESFPLFTADEEVASERELLKSIEDGPYMQEVKYIIMLSRSLVPCVFPGRICYSSSSDLAYKSPRQRHCGTYFFLSLRLQG